MKIIRIVNSDAWGHADWEVEKFVDLVIQAFDKYVYKEVGQITISLGGPMTCRTADKKYDLKITAQNRDFGKLVYEFGHEFCHTFSNLEYLKVRTQWINEMICEVASLWVLQQASDELFKNNADLSNSPNAKLLTDYRDLQLSTRRTFNQINVELPKFVTEQRNILERTNYAMSPSREVQLIIAKQILPFFENNPDNWHAIETLNYPIIEDVSPEVFFDVWQKVTPKYASFIRELGGNLGICF